MAEQVRIGPSCQAQKLLHNWGDRLVERVLIGLDRARTFWAARYGEKSLQYRGVGSVGAWAGLGSDISAVW